MAIHHILNASIYPYYEKMIDYMITERIKIEDEDLNRAINLNIILCCACQIEGILESKTKSIVRYYQGVFSKVNIPKFELRKPMNTFFNSICDDLMQRISQCMGIDKYDDFCVLLLKKSFKQDRNVSPHIEPIQVLFQLRNVIAHGREVSAYEKIIDRDTWQGDEFFFGGYKKAESLLLKKGVIKERFIKFESASMYFVNEVADYFLEVTNEFLTAFCCFIEENLCVDDILTDLVKEFNEKSGTTFTVDNFLENVQIEIPELK